MNIALVGYVLMFHHEELVKKTSTSYKYLNIMYTPSCAQLIEKNQIFLFNLEKDPNKNCLRTLSNEFCRSVTLSA